MIKIKELPIIKLEDNFLNHHQKKIKEIVYLNKLISSNLMKLFNKKLINLVIILTKYPSLKI
jgi:hypothetical protein